MVLNWFRKEPAKPAAGVPRDLVVYAIGDIHGRFDLLEELLAWITEDARAHAAYGRAPQLVFLGDYIDRGPQSREVIDRLSSWDEMGLPAAFLRGNHEQILIDVLDGSASPKAAAAWLEFGGRETMLSYGLPGQLAYSDALDEMIPAFQGLVPAAHGAWLSRTGLTHDIGDYLFVHAGVRPGLDLTEQDPRDLLYIREPFLSSPQNHGKVIVHGHSINTTVEDRPNRIGIDTGAYATGRLTAAVLWDGERRFLSTGNPG